MDLAQMAGWLAAAAAIIAMLQKSDLRLKQGLIIHTVLYGVHFALLGLPTAVVSCVIALARITLSIYTRSLLCAAALIIISIAMALALSRSTVEILPLAASVVLTLSLFRFDGIKLRLGLLPARFFGTFITFAFKAGAASALRLVFVSQHCGVCGRLQESKIRSRRKRFVPKMPFGDLKKAAFAAQEILSS